MATYDDAVENYINSIIETNALLKQRYLNECPNLPYDKWLNYQQFIGRVKLPVDPRYNPKVTISTSTNVVDILLEIDEQARIRYESQF